MDISNESMDSMRKLLEISNVNKYEFEMLVKDTITADEFQRIISLFSNKSNKKYKMEKKLERERLDIRTVNDSMASIRATVTGKSNILNYCKYNKFEKNGDNVELIIKKRAKIDNPSILIPDYNIRINSNIEKEVSSESERKEYFERLENASKFFRYKKTFSFIHASHRVDLSVVKSSRLKMAKNMKISKVLSSDESFEIEIEALNGGKSDTLKDMLNTTANILKEKRQTDYLIGLKQLHTIASDYVNLVDKDVLKEISIEKVFENPSHYYVRYQPVTLMRKNLLPMSIERVSIFNEYSVTEKADGERMLLYIAKDGNMYSINNKLMFNKLGVVHKTARSCIIDGEFVKQGKLGVVLNLYLGFDIYFKDCIDVRKKSLQERISLLTKLMDKDNWDISGENFKMNLQVKQFYFDDENNKKGNIFNYIKTILESLSKFPYETDGLIFTPFNLSPGALYKNDTTMRNFGGTWSKVFKWKPSNENSIDVLVRLGNESIVKHKDEYIKSMNVDLFVGHNGNLEETVDILNLYDNIYKKKNIQKYSNQVVKRLYDSIFLPITGDNKVPITESGEPIQDNTIVEFRYNDDSLTSFRKWIPMRVRKDKTSLYNKTNKIENTANNYNTVMNVWMSINEPITLEMIKGIDELTEENTQLDTKHMYYARDTSRHRSLLRPMLHFHNHWIKKRTLFERYHDRKHNTFKNLKLLEIGCGQGGDLQKWIDNKFALVVGVDNNEDNLLNSDHGIYKRMYELIGSNNQFLRLDFNKQKMIFVMLDGGVKWEKAALKNIKSKELKHLGETIMGVSNKENERNPIIKKFHNVLNEGFDVVSCQFAIHYFFQNKTKFENFVNNVNNSLVVGGEFIGTCLDGLLVDNLLSNKSLVRGNINDKVVWQIEKKYDTFASSSKNDENLGKQIDVYVESINQIIPEYLVDFEMLQRALLTHNIVLKESGSFKELFDDLLLHKKNKNKINWALESAATEMCDVLKEYSFLNRWFVFEKIN